MNKLNKPIAYFQIQSNVVDIFLVYFFGFIAGILYTFDLFYKKILTKQFEYNFFNILEFAKYSVLLLFLCFLLIITIIFFYLYKKNYTHFLNEKSSLGLMNFAQITAFPGITAVLMLYTKNIIFSYFGDFIDTSKEFNISTIDLLLGIYLILFSIKLFGSIWITKKQSDLVPQIETPTLNFPIIFLSIVCGAVIFVKYINKLDFAFPQAFLLSSFVFHTLTYISKNNWIIYLLTKVKLQQKI